MDTPAAKPGPEAAPAPSSPDGVREEGFTRSQFDDAAWSVVLAAADLARKDGWKEVRTPHLVAALIDSPLTVGSRRVDEARLESGRDQAGPCSARCRRSRIRKAPTLR